MIVSNQDLNGSLGSVAAVGTNVLGRTRLVTLGGDAIGAVAGFTSSSDTRLVSVLRVSLASRVLVTLLS